MKTTFHNNWRVEVIPAEPFYIAREPRDKQHKIMLNEMRLLKDEIKRHCDIQFANIEFDTVSECEHCGSGWTEESDTYNGGCCDLDERNNPEAAA